MPKLLNAIQRLLEPLPIRGKGRFAEFVLRGAGEVECHPLPEMRVSLRKSQRIERLMWAGAYERELVAWMKKTLKPGMTVLDLGANIGYFASIASRIVGPSGRVYAFEPVPENFDRLQVNLQPFGWARAYACAVGKAEGVATIYSNENEAGWSSLLSDSDLKPLTTVSVVSLDGWARGQELPRLDFIKMDIEGGEFNALCGASEVLRRYRPTVVAEINSVCLARDGKTSEDMLALLRDAGYGCTPFNDGVLAIPSDPTS